MDIGTIVIHLSHGTPVVSRCEEAPNGFRFVPATNAAELVDAARRVLTLQEVDLREDGLYLCPTELIEAAQLPPLALPADAITFGAARAILYPDVSSNTGWQRVRRDVAAGHLRVYRIGNGVDVTRYVSRAQVLQVAQERAANAAV